MIIDEFGIHLHPELQNAALTRLAKAFPKIQFLVSTHSPLLLNGLKKEQVHILAKDIDGNRIVFNPNTDIIGLGAEGILLRIFGLTTTYDTESLNWVEDYKKLFLKKMQNTLRLVLYILPNLLDFSPQPKIISLAILLMLQITLKLLLKFSLANLSIIIRQ